MKRTGVLQKMPTTYLSPIKYLLYLQEEPIEMNTLLGKDISITHTGYQCLGCGKEKEIYRQGVCKKCFFESPMAGEWIMRPELSKAHLGIADRDLSYEQKMQLQPHVIYLANSSDIKVGVTRLSQTPTRWIDQGAHQAIVLAQVPNRYLAGVGEVALKAHLSDKTAWRKMLTNSLKEIDLPQVKATLKALLPTTIQPYWVENSAVVEISYPVMQYPTKVSSINLLKTPTHSGTLVGIKGQYLLFSDGSVLNIRSHEGFKVDFSF